MANLSQRGEERGAMSGPRDLWDPFRAMDELFRSHPLMRLFEASPSLSSGMLTPAFEVKERDDAYVIEADVPGVREDDLDVTVTGNRLTISGRRDEQREEKKESYYTYERQYGSFSRSFTLPEGVDLDHVDADLDQGVLSIVIPKSEAAKPRTISLKDRIKQKLRS